MCQWSVNLRSRLKDFPLENAEHLDRQIVAHVVPKFHLAAHKEACRINFSLNYEPGVGRSDMEGPERTWFGLQGGGSTKDQGPGYWSDAMDDKLGYWNWSKFIRLGGFILLSFLAYNTLIPIFRYTPCEEVHERPHTVNHTYRRVCRSLCWYPQGYR